MAAGSRTAFTIVLALVVAPLLVAVSATAAARSDTRPPDVGDAARAVESADRRPNRLVEYDVFGDSLVSGLGLPAHLTWVAGVSFHLSVTEGWGVEHRFHNHAVDGQAIITPSALAVDPARSTLIASVSSFVDAPPRATPLDERTIVITPSVNELLISDRGTSARARIDRAVEGVLGARWLLRSAGVPAENIIVLPMPPVGTAFAASFDDARDIDGSLASMISGVNRGLGDVLAVDGYARLDPENDGLADPSVFDQWRGPGGPDGLHLDADGHALLASDVEQLFGTR